MDATNCLAGRSMVSFKNHVIEHPGKGMKLDKVQPNFGKCDRVMTRGRYRQFQPQLFEKPSFINQMGGVLVRQGYVHVRG